MSVWFEQRKILSENFYSQNYGNYKNTNFAWTSYEYLKIKTQ